jgi:hypothetical protein
MSAWQVPVFVAQEVLVELTASLMAVPTESETTRVVRSSLTTVTTSMSPLRTLWLNEAAVCPLEQT